VNAIANDGWAGAIAFVGSRGATIADAFGFV
jgi:hypothetical protein